MVRKLPRLIIPIVCCIASCFMAVRFSFAEEAASSPVQLQTDAKVIHVDKYGIYVPNIVFYWDPTMSKKQISALTSAAERLRNKRATITYSTTGDTAKDKRPLIVDIAPFKEVVKKAEVPKEDASILTVQDDNPITTTTDLGSIRIDEASNFIANCMHATQSKDMALVLACYADKVDYYAKGLVNKEYIRRDKAYYFRLWDTIISSIDGGVELEDTDKDNVKIARFISFFSVENAKKSITGSAENVWKVEKIGRSLKIIDEKQNILTSESDSSLESSRSSW